MRIGTVFFTLVTSFLSYMDSGESELYNLDVYLWKIMLQFMVLCSVLKIRNVEDLELGFGGLMKMCLNILFLI